MNGTYKIRSLPYCYKYLLNWYYRVNPEKVRCQEHIPIILQSEDVEDHLLEKVKSSQETPKNEQVSIDS